MRIGGRSYEKSQSDLPGYVLNWAENTGVCSGVSFKSSLKMVG